MGSDATLSQALAAASPAGWECQNVANIKRKCSAVSGNPGPAFPSSLLVTLVSTSNRLSVDIGDSRPCAIGNLLKTQGKN
jgi:hypothetical protein